MMHYSYIMEKLSINNVRRCLRVVGTFVCLPLFLPHLLMLFMMGGGKKLVFQDVARYKTKNSWPKWFSLCYVLYVDRWYRSVFVQRLGPVKGEIVKRLLPRDKTFFIPYHVKIGGGISGAHPFSTDLNAESIGENFSFKNSTTIGCKNHKRPIIGNNVEVGVNVVIIGNVNIGDNAIIGAGAVVVKDVPKNAVVAGNPAKVLYFRKDV